jgi:hypothetical protein
MKFTWSPKERVIIVPFSIFIMALRNISSLSFGTFKLGYLLVPLFTLAARLSFLLVVLF